MIVADDFALLFAVVLPNHALAAEGHPLHERVPGFGDIGSSVDRPPQVFISEEAEEEERAHDTAEFAKGPLQFVLSAVRPERAQNRGGANLALTDRQGHSEHVGQMRLDRTLLAGVLDFRLPRLFPSRC